MTVYLDTNILIYLVEKVSDWRPKVEARLLAIRQPDEPLVLAFSDLSRLECLVAPLRQHDAALYRNYTEFFTGPDGLIVPLPVPVFDLAAEIRAAYRFKTIDALHLAAAVKARCDAFLTNDLKLGTFSGLPVEVLS